MELLKQRIFRRMKIREQIWSEQYNVLCVQRHLLAVFFRTSVQVSHEPELRSEIYDIASRGDFHLHIRKTGNQDIKCFYPCPGIFWDDAIPSEICNKIEGFIAETRTLSRKYFLEPANQEGILPTSIKIAD